MVTLSFNPEAVAHVVLWILGLLVAGFVIRGLFRAVRRLLFKPELHGLDRAGIVARWTEIERQAASGNEMSYKLAVMEADKLLDHALKAMAMPGTTLGERLKFAEYKYPKIREAWWPHKLRNRLVHESSFYLEPHMAKKAIAVYKDALRTLNLL